MYLTESKKKKEQLPNRNPKNFNDDRFCCNFFRFSAYILFNLMFRYRCNKKKKIRLLLLLVFAGVAVGWCIRKIDKLEFANWTNSSVFFLSRIYIILFSYFITRLFSFYFFLVPNTFSIKLTSSNRKKNNFFFLLLLLVCCCCFFFSFAHDK